MMPRNQICRGSVRRKKSTPSMSMCRDRVLGLSSPLYDASEYHGKWQGRLWSCGRQTSIITATVIVTCCVPILSGDHEAFQNAPRGSWSLSSVQAHHSPLITL